MATAIGASRTGDEEVHQVMLTRISGRFGAAFRQKQGGASRPPLLSRALEVSRPPDPNAVANARAMSP